MSTLTRQKRTLLIFSQVYVPDPAGVGQYMADAAQEMARRGWRVRVYASARGFEDPRTKYPARETIGGVEVRRLALASFGKKSIVARLLGAAAFMGQALGAGLLTRDVGAILFSTSPPMMGLVGSIVGLLRRVPTAYWAMDLNPDQLIALGKLTPRSPVARLMEAVNRAILFRTNLIVALDRFMAERIRARSPALSHKILVIPPWPYDEQIEPRSPVGDAKPFRVRHGLVGQFVVMYSGNHSPSNPLDTLLAAAVALRDEPGLRFVFVGGGAGKRDVESAVREHGLRGVISLPYQPFAELGDLLSAADVHVVALGDPMVGVIHPCKIYGAMSAARPVLYFGPSPSHVTDLLDEHAIGTRVSHGDAAGAVAAIERFRRLPPAQLDRMGSAAREALRRSLSQQALRGQFCDALERLLKRTADPRDQARSGEPPVVARGS